MDQLITSARMTRLNSADKAEEAEREGRGERSGRGAKRFIPWYEYRTRTALLYGMSRGDDEGVKMSLVSHGGSGIPRAYLLVLVRFRMCSRETKKTSARSQCIAETY